MKLKFGAHFEMFFGEIRGQSLYFGPIILEPSSNSVYRLTFGGLLDFHRSMIPYDLDCEIKFKEDQK